MEDPVVLSEATRNVIAIVGFSLIGLACIGLALSPLLAMWSSGYFRSRNL